MRQAEFTIRFVIEQIGRIRGGSGVSLADGVGVAEDFLLDDVEILLEFRIDGNHLFLGIGDHDGERHGAQDQFQLGVGIFELGHVLGDADGTDEFAAVVKDR